MGLSGSVPEQSQDPRLDRLDRYAARDRDREQFATLFDPAINLLPTISAAVMVPRKNKGTATGFLRGECEANHCAFFRTTVVASPVFVDTLPHHAIDDGKPPW